MQAQFTNASMTLEQARQVIWPFREFRGQTIGDLIDKNAITSRDLGFAFDRAYDNRVREAARTLLLHELNQSIEIPDSPGPVRIIASERRSYAERKQMQWTLMSGAVMGLFMGIMLGFLVIVLIVNAVNVESTPADTLTIPQLVFGFGFVVLIVFGPQALMRILNARIDRKIEEFRKGQIGEERVLNTIMSTLDGHWQVFRNLELPGRRQGDIDMVLVGPKGIWVLEIKHYQGVYRNTGDQWERRFRGKWLSAFANPTRQAKRNAASLGQIFQTDKVNQWVTPVVVWSNTDSRLIIDTPGAQVWQIDKLAEELRYLQNSDRSAIAQRERILKILTAIADRS